MSKPLCWYSTFDLFCPSVKCDCSSKHKFTNWDTNFPIICLRLANKVFLQICEIHKVN